MANKEVNLTKRVQTARGLRYCPVVISANGRVKPDFVVVDGREERHPEGAYYIEWRHGSKRRVRLSVGKDAQDAALQRQRKEAELTASNLGVQVMPDDQSRRRTLAAAIADYLEDIKLTKKPKTHAAYSTSLAYFSESVHKVHLESVDRKDLLKFIAFLRDDKEQSPRSCWNKFANVMSFLKANNITGLVKKNDWPRYTEEEPEIYEDDELESFFSVCDEEERVWYKFFLMTGEREQEVMHTYWTDINFASRIVRVSHKADLGWTPKTYKEREIPIPDELVDLLKQWRAKNSRGCRILFPTSGGNPKLDFLDCVKAVAERAGLDPEMFWLHKFRATFATRHIWNGLDFPTAQKWLGHRDVASTMRYAKPRRNADVRDKVNAAFAASTSVSA